MSSLVHPASELRELRQLCHLTQREAADVVGVSRRTWIRYEKGERPMFLGLYRYFKHFVRILRKRQQQEEEATAPSQHQNDMRSMLRDRAQIW
jgi:DNA-binding XRE family transcriptional regulator